MIVAKTITDFFQFKYLFIKMYLLIENAISFDNAHLGWSSDEKEPFLRE